MPDGRVGAAAPAQPPGPAADARTRIAAAGTGSGWLGMLRWYLGVSLAGHLVWEFAQMPLYTLSATGTAGEVLFAGLHCTGGDLLIATVTLAFALVAAGDDRWPALGAAPVFAILLVTGLGYTVFSEWLNVEVREAWAYLPAMPTVPPLGTGVTPLLQWLVVPTAAYWIAASRARASRPRG